MVNGLLSLDQFTDYMKGLSPSIKGIFSGIMFLGSLLALPITPYIADGLGRRWGICIGSIIMIFAVVLQSASVNFSMFIAARFFLGFGVAIAHGSAPLLITELCHPQHRAIFTTIVSLPLLLINVCSDFFKYNTTWYVGSIIAAWLTYGTNRIPSQWSWRIPSIVQALPSILQITCVWLVPESPRWYISKGQTERALNVLAKVHAEGNDQDEIVQLEFEEIKETIAFEKEAEQTGWLELFKTKGNRHRLLILISAGLFSQWSGNGLVSYYITGVLDGIGITDPDTQLVINGVLNIWNCIVAVTMCTSPNLPNPSTRKALTLTRLLRRQDRPPTPLPRLNRRHGALLRHLDNLLRALQRHRDQGQRQRRRRNDLPLLHLLQPRLVGPPRRIHGRDPALLAPRKGHVLHVCLCRCRAVL
jgi:MFS family permease